MKKQNEALAVLREYGFKYDAVTPWVCHAASRIPEHGHWADYAGWEAWMTEKLDEPCASFCGGSCMTCNAFREWDDLTYALKTQLYVLMSNEFATPSPASSKAKDSPR